jgi:hypothetical protein
MKNVEDDLRVVIVDIRVVTAAEEEHVKSGYPEPPD